MAKDVTQDGLTDLYNWGDFELRSYQLEGVNWLLGCHAKGHGCILADEMGLGKTCQAIALLTVAKHNSSSGKPHLVVCPRSVLENWEKEFGRFSPSLEVQTYVGDKDHRAQVAQRINRGKKRTFDVLLTTYELCLKDYIFLKSITWDVLVVDEGHRLKNHESLLYTTLEEWNIETRVLLTGTPVQNNLRELYSLLSFVDSKNFRLSKIDNFVTKYSSKENDIEDLHKLMEPYLLRRTKAAVLQDLPERSDIVLYHGISAVQKKLYKAILTKDIGVFENSHGPNQTRLMNILMQLRKCVNHPYLFDGVEPEPFQLGEHLVEASSKLCLIDRLLEHLKQTGHKVLLFSQMARMLDILQDYLGYRGYTYERLDGSVRGEERFLAVQSFNENDETFVFLLSTKAGGQGLNLTSADTVIFVDSDYNPQNDLQAAARVHRIGQDRPVKIIRLIGRQTVEEIILRRAEEKLRLTEKVVESGHFAASTSLPGGQTQSQLQEILKFGVDELLSETSSDETLDLEELLGQSNDSQWVTTTDEKQTDEKNSKDKEDSDGDDAPQSMYMFEGTDYSKEPSAADVTAFENLIKAEKEAVMTTSVVGERALRRAGTSITGLVSTLPRRPQKTLTPEELEERAKKRQEAAEKRAKKAEETKKLQQEREKQRREKLWKVNNYTSLSVTLDSEGEEKDEEEEKTFVLDDEEEEDAESTSQQKKKLAIRYVSGDVTHPVDAGTDDNIIVHCADNSGYWGTGGLFSAISARSLEPQMKYAEAEKMKDLNLGDCHLIPIDDLESREDGRDYLALICAQDRNKRTNKLSGIKLSHLDVGLKKLFKVASEKKASVHLPRIGHDTPQFNWYGTERLIQKHLSSQGIPTSIYYFPRRRGKKRKMGAPATNQPTKVIHRRNSSPSPSRDENSDSPVPSPTSASSPSSSSAALASNASPATSSTCLGSKFPSSLPPLFSDLKFCFYGLSGDKLKRLKRHVLAYDGSVETEVSDSTTYLIAEEDEDKEGLEKEAEEVKCPIVRPAWLEECIEEEKILPIYNYLVTFD